MDSLTASLDSLEISCQGGKKKSETIENRVVPPRDRLSGLPDEILISILDCMPLKFAVRCSALSNRWKYLYTFLPRLQFIGSELAHNADTPEAKGTIEDIISSVLQNYRGTLFSFELRIGNVQQWEFTRPKVSEWVALAAAHDVQQLSISEFYEPRPRDEPPPTIFTCTNLTNLAMEDYYLRRFPLDFPGFNKLTFCNLSFVTFEDDKVVENMVSNCPILQQLHMFHFYGLRSFKVCSPTLRCLQMDSPSCEAEVIDIECPQLEYMSITWKSLKMFKCGRVLLHELSDLGFGGWLSCDGELTKLVIQNIEEGIDFLPKLKDLIESSKGCLQGVRYVALKGTTVVCEEVKDLLKHLEERIPLLETMSLVVDDHYQEEVMHLVRTPLEENTPE